MIYFIKGDKKMKKKVIFTTILVIICLISTTIYGSLSGSLQAIASKTTVSPGEEITITVKVSNITTSNQGVAGFESKLQYDKDVFEEVKVNDITSSWTVENMDPSTLLSVMTTNPVSADTNIFTIKMKVKEEAKAGSTTISFSDPKIFNLNDTFSATIDSLNITVEKEAAKTPAETPANTKGNLPKTGKESYIFITIVLTMIIGAISYINYLKNKNV